MSNSLVYVIGVDEQPVKIGTAVNIANRLCSLQVGCPDELKVFHLERVPDWAALNVESLTHRSLESRHRRGEWFNVHHKEAAEHVAYAAHLIVKKGREWAIKHGSVLEKSLAEFDLNSTAYDAVRLYQRYLPDPQRVPYIGWYNKQIIERAGAAAFNIFRLVIVSGVPADAILANKDRKLRRKAMEALVEALRVLEDCFSRHKEADLEKAIDKSWQITP